MEKITSQNIQMVDLNGQYKKIEVEVNEAIQEVINSSHFINGPQVKAFAQDLAHYLQVKQVIPCANGTDALQIALMAFDLKPGDEVIVPAFTYIASVEVIALLGLIPILVDVDPNTFNVSVDAIRQAITPRTKVILPVHLFGQCANMEAIMSIAKEHKLWVLEDNAQAIGAQYTFSDGSTQSAGTIGDIGTTSFFPSKNLGCFGDGGAMTTNNEELAQNTRIVASHGQTKKYIHDVIGVNSRLDTIQAALLQVKLQHLDSYIEARQKAATYYDQAFAEFEHLKTPVRSNTSTHVFHQYTLQMDDPSKRDQLKEYLQKIGIPSMIYYPLPIHFQKAFKHFENIEYKKGDFPVAEKLCESVISLPIHTELNESTQDYIIEHVKRFFN
ncbi:DegT/DnrJ/EryC1/StrS family aminotransferase [Microscilla marina]|uniref:Pigmentation and extracellular proteinase regulator n=1 Tax=Microscilla marina ATCC 23134 TaxID=313606 RepID=A1ZIA3_MICM2|nr:DegT/DnrJ/EryC1/StrS family aminotransferase [Microscilla marina]EAY29771.1 pigmentation and extracellular proteinase regulator [Microscilla marina ATCC 23134]